MLSSALVLYCIVLYLSISIALLTALAFQRRSQPQQLVLCQSLHAKALQATVSEELARGPYMAARARFKSTTLWLKCIDSSNAPPCPASNISLTVLAKSCQKLAWDNAMANTFF